MGNTAIKELFDSLYLADRTLTGGQLQFIEGCKKQFARTKELSEKQLFTLREIRKYLNVSDQQVRFSGAEVSKASGMKTEGLK